MLEKETTAHQIASMAQRAVLYEVTATPKPGLVDRNDSGAHQDMDFYTFMDSSVSLYKGFFDCAMAGLSFDESDLSQLMDQIRRPGMACEAHMFRATKGINTHKGIIFSLGIACAATGYLKRPIIAPVGSKGKAQTLTMEKICKTVSQMTGHLVAKDFKDIAAKDVKTLTYGEKQYLHYGFTGIRGEVASGFATIQRETFKTLRTWKKKEVLKHNELSLELLLRLMQSAEDTNLINRGGIDGLVFAKRHAKAFVDAGGMTQEDAFEQLERLNLLFCDHRLSPGGSADLLSVALFLAMNEGIL